MNIQRCDGCRDLYEPTQPMRYSLTDSKGPQHWVPNFHFCSLKCIQTWLTAQVVGNV